VITFMLGGTALALTSLVLAWRALGRVLAGVLVTPRNPAAVSAKAWAAEVD
jgi:hypothetical protein